MNERDKTCIERINDELQFITKTISNTDKFKGQMLGLSPPSSLNLFPNLWVKGRLGGSNDGVV